MNIAKIVFVLTIICSLLVFSFVGCAEKQEPTPEPTPAPTPEPDPTPEPEPTPAPKTETQLLAELNTATTTALQGKDATAPYDVLTILGAAQVDFGPINEKLATGHILGYNVSTKAFVIVDTAALDGIASKENIFVTVKDAEEFTTYTGYGFSVYLDNNYSATAIELEAVGLDVGSNEGIATITYAGTKNVVIRTNGGTLTVGSSTEVASGTITHYGTLNEAIVYTTTSSFHTHGKIADLDLKAGKAVAEDKGYVALAKAAEGTQVEESGTGVVYIPAGVAIADIDNAVAVGLGYVSDGNTEATYIIDTSTEKGQEKAGTIANTVYEITCKADLLIFRDKWNAGKLEGKTYKLMVDIDISDLAWQPIGNRAHPFYGTFLGNGHIINGLKNDGYYIDANDVMTTSSTNINGAAYGFFGVVGKGSEAVSISNFKLTSVNLDGIGNNMCGAVVGADMNAAKVGSKDYSGNITIDKVEVSGTRVKAIDSVGGIMGKAYTTGGVTITNCVTDISVEVTNDGTKLAGILGYASGPSSVIVKDNTIKGDVVLAKITASKAVTASRGIIDMTANTANKVGKDFVFGDSVNTVIGKMLVGTDEYKHPYTLEYTFDQSGNATSVTYAYIKESARSLGDNYLANQLIFFYDGTTVVDLEHDAFYNDGVYTDAVDCFGTVVINNSIINVINAESGASLTLNNCTAQRVNTYNKFAQSANTVGNGKVYIYGGNYTGEGTSTQNCLSTTVSGSSANGRANITVYSGSFADGYISQCLPGTDSSDFLAGDNASYNCTYEGVTYTVNRQGGSNCWVVTNAPVEP